ncbi:MAG: ATP-binding protein [Methanocellales archaeon]|nr:ATP-binding protein [Methanocellales archaeon]
MVRKSIGVIFGETTPLEFKFAVADSRATKRGGYVKVWHESNGWVLGQVVSMTKSSDAYSLDAAISVVSGVKIAESGGKVVAKVGIIGSRDEQGLLRPPKTPFNPGDNVYEADRELIRSVLGLGEGDIYLGLLEGHDTPVYLDANKLVQKHCSILARSGSGKSYTAGVLIEELLEQNVPLLIIDPHGEYVSLKHENSDRAQQNLMKKFGIEPKGYASQVVVYTPANLTLNPEADKVFRLDGVNLSTRNIALMLPTELSDTQMGILHQAIKKVEEEKGLYTIDDIILAVGESRSKAKWSVINSLEMLRETGILSSTPTTIDELVQSGTASIIDMRGMPPDLQSVVVARLCENLFAARKAGKIPPAMLVVEEGHNFCPERGYGKAASTDILRTIASEGRKFGLGLTIISQRPARIDKNVLSQCNTQIIMKVTNPNDIQAIGKSIEGFSSELEGDIKRLPPGVALLVSNDIEYPVLVDVRIRRSLHGGRSIRIVGRGA